MIEQVHSRTASRIQAPADPSDILLGVEQEFELFQNGERLDFRTLFPSLVSRLSSVPFRDSDTAVLLEAGYMLACDGQDAEIATAPISYRRAGLPTLAREVSRCRGHLLQLLANHGIREVRGYSTHVSVSVPAGHEWEFATAAACTFAPALLLLMEARVSPGLLIRPRRGRLEIGSEYIDSEEQLEACLVFLAAAAHAWAQAGTTWGKLPRVRLERWQEANIRPGIYLPPDAFGESLHQHGRLAVLELEQGGRTTAGKLLESAADLLLAGVDKHVSPEATRILSEFARGDRTLQIELDTDPDLIAPGGARTAAPECADIISIVTAPQTLGLTPRFVDWHGAAFSPTDLKEPLVVAMPWAQLPRFFTEARESGRPNAVPSGRAGERILNSLDQLQSPGIYQEIDAAALGEQAAEVKAKMGTGYPVPPYDVPVARPLSSRPGGALAWIIGLAALALAVGLVALGFRQGWLTGNTGTEQPASVPLALATTVSPLPTSAAAPVVPAAEKVPARIHIITSSDWTSVGLVGAQFDAVSIKSASSEATTAALDPGLGLINLNQPLDRAGIRSVELVADFSIVAGPAAQVSIFIERGDIGETTLDLFATSGSNPVLIETLHWPGIASGTRNRAVFPIALSDFSRAQATPATLDASVRAGFCSKGMGGMTFDMPERVTDVDDFAVVSDGAALDCVIVDGRLVCFGLKSDSIASGTICGAGTNSAAGCVEFGVQVPDCTAVQSSRPKGSSGCGDLYYEYGGECLPVVR